MMTPLRQRMLEELQRRNYSSKTIRLYLRHVAEFAKHFRRSPDQLGAEDIRQYQLFLIQEKKLAWSSYNQIVCALRFFYAKNMDNLFLKSELKSSRDDIEMTKGRWVYGLVLMGLALLHDDVQTKKSRPVNATAEQEPESIEKQIEHFTQALAPVLLPMINSLGAMELDAALAATVSGEAT